MFSLSLGAVQKVDLGQWLDYTFKMIPLPICQCVFSNQETMRNC